MPESVEVLLGHDHLFLAIFHSLYCIQVANTLHYLVMDRLRLIEMLHLACWTQYTNLTNMGSHSLLGIGTVYLIAFARYLFIC